MSARIRICRGLPEFAFASVGFGPPGPAEGRWLEGSFLQVMEGCWNQKSIFAIFMMYLTVYHVFVIISAGHVARRAAGEASLVLGPVRVLLHLSQTLYHQQQHQQQQQQQQQQQSSSPQW